jgi:hypothetical protein
MEKPELGLPFMLVVRDDKPTNPAHVWLAFLKGEELEKWWNIYLMQDWGQVRESAAATFGEAHKLTLAEGEKMLMALKPVHLQVGAGTTISDLNRRAAR